MDIRNKTEQLLLIVVGQVFDVTNGTEFYANGQSYEGFATGHDASRAFLTADFEKNATDDLTDLTLTQCLGVEHWLNFYHNHSTYTFEGVHQGRYYDRLGQPTDNLREFEACCLEAHDVSAKATPLVEPAPRCQRSRASGFGTGVWYHFECPKGLVPHRAELPDLGERCSCLGEVPVPTPWGERVNDVTPKPYAGCAPSENLSKCTLKLA